MRDVRVAGATLAALLAAAAPAAAEQPGIEGTMGPSTSTPPYVLPAADGVRTASLLTVGDAVGDEDYRMVGIPDGLGAYRQDGNALTLLMNHELNDMSGTVRRHGQIGAFVSEWSIDRKSFAVTAGADLIDPGVQYWNYALGTYAPVPAGFGAPFDRFCSNTLTDAGQLFNEATGNGYAGQLFFPNEENGNIGRAFGLTTDGEMAQLPRLGLASFENTLPAHNTTDTTLTVGTEDGASGQLRVYAGTKQASGSPFDRAGLTNGALSVVAVADAATDPAFRVAHPKGEPARFTLAPVDWNTPDGNAQNVQARERGLSLNRIEDAHWDPSNPRDLYFLTTEGGVGATSGATGRDGGGLWRLRFDDIEQPQLGGTPTLLLDGSEEPKLNKPDNMTIDGTGNLLIQEDPGNNVSVARIVAYRIEDGARAVLARFDPTLFAQGGELTIDEESSGIIDAHATIGPRWFLFDAQVHRPAGDPELVQMGQLLALHVDRWKDVY
jgi:hypothetical protein